MSLGKPEHVGSHAGSGRRRERGSDSIRYAKKRGRKVRRRKIKAMDKDFMTLPTRWYGFFD